MLNVYSDNSSRTNVTSVERYFRVINRCQNCLANEKKSNRVRNNEMRWKVFRIFVYVVNLIHNLRKWFIELNRTSILNYINVVVIRKLSSIPTLNPFKTNETANETIKLPFLLQNNKITLWPYKSIKTNPRSFASDLAFKTWLFLDLFCLFTLRSRSKHSLRLSYFILHII